MGNSWLCTIGESMVNDMFLYGSYGVVEVLCTLVKPYHLCHVINLCWSTISSVWISRSFDSWLCIIDGYLNW